MTVNRRARIWNDDDKDYSEDFRGEIITIKAHDFKEMDLSDATAFRGQFTPFSLDDLGNQSGVIKRLRIERLPTDDTGTTTELRCMACPAMFQTQAQLDTHVQQVHEHLIVDRKSKEEFAQKRKH